MTLQPEYLTAGDADNRKTAYDKGFEASERPTRAMPIPTSQVQQITRGGIAAGANNSTSSAETLKLLSITTSFNTFHLLSSD